MANRIRGITVEIEELEATKKEVEKVTGEKPISQKMFRAV